MTTHITSEQAAWAKSAAVRCAESGNDTNVIASAMKEGAEMWPGITGPRMALSARIYALANNLDPNAYVTECLEE